MTREVLSLACGKQIYFEMVATLARSFRWHNKENGISFTIATDDPAKIPADVAEWCEVHVIEDSDAVGFELKLSLDLYSKADRTLFIDADCVVTRDLTEIFEAFEGKTFTCLGRNLSEGEWFGDIAARCKSIGTDEIPVFVGAVYYFERGIKSKTVFDEARAQAEHYDDLGIVRLRGRKNEEPLISIGMAKHGYQASKDTGQFKCDVMGTVEFNEPRRDFLHVPFCDETAHPAIAHFNDAFTSMWEYRKEDVRLRLIMAEGKSPSAAALSAKLGTELPGRSKRFLKETLRPVYHRLFGARKVKQNERINHERKNHRTWTLPHRHYQPRPLFEEVGI